MSPIEPPRRVAILGSSGSIGRNALEVIAESSHRLDAILLSVHNRTDVLLEQVKKMAMQSLADRIQSQEPSDRVSRLPRWVVVTDETADRTPLEKLPPGIEVRFGMEALCELVQHPDIDFVLSAIVGSAGLRSTWSALEAGKSIALANKESLVMGGQLITELAKKKNALLLPVDSEHSAILQALQSFTIDKCFTSPIFNTDRTTDYVPFVEKIILTASGGPFRTYSLSELEKVTVNDALAHPTWNMGRKITVDSATLMNKALEIIEARWLFNIPVNRIEAIIHPQSIVHSMVEFIDGSTIAQLSPPDMRLPIQIALDFPHRHPGPALKLDWKKGMSLEFYPPDTERFPAIALGLEVAQVGGTAGAVINAANEVAVAAFLSGKLQFNQIVTACRCVLENHPYEQRPTLERIFELDAWARKETEKWIAQ